MSFTSFDQFGYVDERDGKLEIVGDTGATPEIVGYLYCGQFICTFCANDEFSGEMDAFFADNPTPLTYEEAQEQGHTECEFAGHHKQAEDKPITYSLLVSNVGWVRNDCLSYDEVKALFDEYAASKQYEQVTMWSSAEIGPVEEAYVDENDELIAEMMAPIHPRYDDNAEFDYYGG